jgi:hypothetical protein
MKKRIDGFCPDFSRLHDRRDERVGRYRFDEEFKRSAGSNVHLEYFTQTGSDANNSLYDIAEKAVDEQERLGLRPRREKGPGTPQAEILVLDGVYGAGNGRMARVGLRTKDPHNKDLRMDSPETQNWNPHETTSS